MDRHLADRLAIRDVVETWVIARDSGDWETFRGTWHDDGYMMATWWQGPAEEFTEVSRAGWERGVNIMHFLGGCRVTVAGDRAIAQTKPFDRPRPFDRPGHAHRGPRHRCLDGAHAAGRPVRARPYVHRW